MEKSIIQNIPNRILSIDIMRGLTLFLMLFVNDLYESGVPEWLVHTKTNFDGMGLADWVFPGFLFMVGISIPFAFFSRRNKGESNQQILGHIFARTVSLLIIGVFMLNGDRLNSELSGIDNLLWSILVYIFIFFVWNRYPENPDRKKLFLGLKLFGIIGLIVMALIFRAGEPDNIKWLETSWWGILGIIGWSYFVATVVFLLAGQRIWANLVVLLFFIGLNILSQMGFLDFLKSIKPVFGVLISGNVPSIVMSGLIVGLVLKKYLSEPKRIILIVTVFAVLSLIAGFFLRNWFIISKNLGTPSWALICNGISMFVFVLLYYIIDVMKKNRWAKVFLPAGQNSLTTYLAPDLIYFMIWGLGLPILFYKQDSSELLAVGGSLVWAFTMIGFAALLSKINIRLKL